MVTNEALEEGEVFHQQINNIIEIINGVEKQTSQIKFQTQFDKQLDHAKLSRKIGTERTDRAQKVYQNNYSIA
jgi:hypothetical protein